MKRVRAFFLLVLLWTTPAYGQQSTKALLSTYTPQTGSEVELTDLLNTVTIADGTVTVLSSFTLVIFNGTTRTLDVTMRVTRDGSTENSQTITVPTGTKTIQLNSTLNGLTVGSHSWRGYVTSAGSGTISYTTASNLYIGGVSGISVINTGGAVAKTGDTMSGVLDMGSNKITSLGTPTVGTDAVNKTYADLKLALAGGTMSGAIAMGTSKITGLGTPTTGTDAATKAYADLMLPLTGGTMSGAIAMGTSKITGLGTPTTGTDAATKTYVDGFIKADGTTPLTAAWATGSFNISAGPNTFLTLPHTGGSSDLVDMPDFFWDNAHRRIQARTALFREIGDPVDIMIGRAEGTYPDTPSASGLANGTSIGTIYWVASCGSACGFQNRAAQIYVRNTMVPINGQTGGDLWFATTVTGAASTTDALVIRQNQSIIAMNNKIVGFRNAANSADVNALRLDNSNILEIGRDSVVTKYRFFSGFDWFSDSGGGTTWMTLNSTNLQLNGVNLLNRSVLQANLGTPSNGTQVYCSDCTTASACTGGGTGAFASRQNGAWKCL